MKKKTPNKKQPAAPKAVVVKSNADVVVIKSAPKAKVPAKKRGGSK